MKKLFCLIAIISIFSCGPAAATDWNKSLDIGITLNQSKSKVNPAGTMKIKQNVNIGFIVDGSLVKNTDIVSWKNTLELDYARSKTNERLGEATTGNDWVEDIDQLILDSVHIWKNQQFLNPYAAMNIQTSILDSTDSDNWEAFRPVQFRESFGGGMRFIEKEKEMFTGRAGVFYQHYLKKPAVNYYEDSSGFEFVLDYSSEFKPDMKFKSKMGIYADLKNTTAPWDANKRIKKVKLEWDNAYIAQITKHLGLRLSLNIDNIDITESVTHYEWEEKMDLVYRYKIF